MNIKKNDIFINFGGVFPFFLIPISEISEISDIIKGEIHDINFIDTEFTPYYISTIQESSKLTEKQNLIDNFEYILTAVISKNSLYYRNIIEALDSDKHICIVPDANQNFRVIGNLESGAILSSDSDTGSNVSELNNISISLKWQSKYRAAYTDLYKNFIMKCDTDIAIQPYISTSGVINILKNTTGILRIDGANFDQNMTIDLGSSIVVNSYSAFDTFIEIHYTASNIVSTHSISIKRGDFEHYGNTPSIAVISVLTGDGPAGVFTTQMSVLSPPDKPYGTNWNMFVFGTINSVADFFKLLRNNQSSPSSGTGPDSGDGSDYSFIETSNHNNGDGQYAEAITSYFHKITHIQFRYHRFGRNSGDFVIYSLNADNVWIEVFRLAGEQQTSGSDLWLTASIDMSAVQCKAVKFTNQFANGYRGDMAIDDIIITST